MEVSGRDMDVVRGDVWSVGMCLTMDSLMVSFCVVVLFLPSLLTSTFFANNITRDRHY